ncbi:MAG: two-component system sensor histidine kinase NtrB [Thermodesulfovibrionales bacterium]
MTTSSIPSIKRTSYLVLALVAATSITMASVFLTYRSALQASEDSLKLMALGMAVSLEATLSRMEKDRESLFGDIITEGRWEGIAFIALCDRQGRILLHSNAHLMNRQIPDSQISQVSEQGTPQHDYATLGTGERVFLLYFPVHLPQGTAVLKLALHTYPAEKIIREARTQVALISFITLALWITAFFFIRAMKRAEKMEKLIAEKEQMAVLGEMASTLAHEIRNPLGSIKGFAQYVMEQDLQNSRKYLDIIVAESERLETLTEDLLRYSRPEKVSPVLCNLSELVDEVLLRGIIDSPPDSSIKRTITIPAGLSIMTDRDKLKQILLNLLQNARDAVGERSAAGAAISISAAGVDNDTICIIIEDNGPGMDRTTLDSALQPFFTTKTKGTGLGLAIVGKLVKALGGSIELQSGQGQGSVVRIYLPGELH